MLVITRLYTVLTGSIMIAIVVLPMHPCLQRANLRERFANIMPNHWQPATGVLSEEPHQRMRLDACTLTRQAPCCQRTATWRNADSCGCGCVLSEMKWRPIETVCNAM
jgi:hypothetical protein